MKIPARSNHRRFLLLQAAAIGLLAASSVHAATIDWSGATSTAWATGSNWAGGTAPVDNLTTDIANFNVATYGGNPVYAPNAGTRSINGITIGGSNASSGTMTLTTTSLSIGGSGISIAEGAGVLRITGGLTLGAAQSWTNNSANAFNVLASVNNGGFLLTVDGTGAASTISGTISGAGGLAKQSAGDLTLSGTNTYSGATTISVGRLPLNSAGALSPNTAVTVSSGAQLFFNTNAGNKTYANAMTISGVGTAESSGIQVGAIRLENGVTLGGTMTLPADARVGVLGVRSGTISGQVTGPGGLEFYGVKNGNNQNSGFTLSNTGNDYAGTTTISSANFDGTNRTGANNTLKLGASGVIPDGVGKGLVAFTGTSASHTNILDLNGFAETVNGLSTTGAAVARITNTAAGTAVLTVGAADTTSSFSGVITEAGSGAILALTKTGTGTLTLSAANSYTGNTTINAGTIEIGNATALGSSGTITFGGGGLKYGTGITQDLSSRIKNSGSAILVDTNGQSVTWGTALDSTNSGGLSKNAAGTLTLSGSSTYTGTTTINAGTLALSGSGSIATSSGVSLSASGAGLDISGASGNRTIGSFAGAAGSAVVLGGNTLTAGDATNTTFAGVIAGSGGFTKVGGGALSLTSIQDFTGPLSVSAGSLAVSGTNLLADASRIDVLAGATLDATAAGIQIVDGQTLGGYGTVSGDLAFASGAILSPGGSVGTLSGTAGTTTWNSGLIYEFEVNNATGTPGIDPGWDLFNTTGGLTLAAGPAFADQIVIDLISLSGTGSGQAANFDASANYQWRFAVAGSAITTFDASWFRVQTTGFQNPVNGSFSVARGGATSFGGTDNQALYVVYAAVPEPGTLALAGIGLAGVAWAVTRRRRRGAA